MPSNLANMGVNQQEIDFYGREFASGRRIVTVVGDGRQQEVIDILASSGANNPNLTFSKL
jgi:hypothetical protein